MIVLGAVAIFVWHRALLHFGIGRRYAMFLALAFALSPIYMILTVSFMTDITGFLSFAVCVIMCQRAVLAHSGRLTAVWLLFACAVNLVGGSARQVGWLGALVMVPSTAWLLRGRRGALWAGGASIVLSPIIIQIYMHWYLRQPYVVPEKYLLGAVGSKELRSFVMNWTGALLLLTVAVAPMGIAWISKIWTLSRFAVLRVLVGMVLGVLYLLKLTHRPPVKLAEGVFPWLEPVYEACGFPYGTAAFHSPAVMGLLARSIFSILILGSFLILIELLYGHYRTDPKKESDFRAMFWILIPYGLAYIGAVSGRAMFDVIQDRYLIFLVPIAMVWMARFYEQRFDSRVPFAGVVAMVLIAIFTVAANATIFSVLRAEDRLDERLRESGMPRSDFAEGFGLDLAEQISNGGHVNDKRFANLPGGYDASVKRWDLPEGCEVFYDQLTSKIRPKYFAVGQLDNYCYVMSTFSSENYRAYLPPFDRQIVVAESASQAKHDR